MLKQIEIEVTTARRGVLRDLEMWWSTAVLEGVVAAEECGSWRPGRERGRARLVLSGLLVYPRLLERGDVSEIGRKLRGLLEADEVRFEVRRSARSWTADHGYWMGRGAPKKMVMEYAPLQGLPPFWTADRAKVVSPVVLGLSQELRNDVWAWDIAARAIYRVWLYAEDEGIMTPREIGAAKRAVDRRGRVLARRVAKETGSEVEYR